MHEIVGHLENVCELLVHPAHLFLSAHVECHVAAAHVMLYGDWDSSSFDEGEPVESLRICTEVLIDNRVAHLRHICRFDELGQLSEVYLVDKEDVVATTIDATTFPLECKSHTFQGGH